MKPITIIGYSGHSYVIYDIFHSMGKKITGYCESEFKEFNPYNLEFYGSETSEKGLEALKNSNYFIAIGNNRIRRKIQESLIAKGLPLACNAIHSSAIIGSLVKMGEGGIMIAPNAVVNAKAEISTGAVINTSTIIEHEVKIGKYCFVSPGSTLLGGVEVGDNSFIGGNAVIKQNVKIGGNCIIGAGTVVLSDIPSNSKVVGNPQRFI